MFLKTKSDISPKDLKSQQQEILKRTKGVHFSLGQDAPDFNVNKFDKPDQKSYVKREQAIQQAKE